MGKMGMLEFLLCLKSQKCDVNGLSCAISVHLDYVSVDGVAVGHFGVKKGLTGLIGSVLWAQSCPLFPEVQQKCSPSLD